MRGIDKSKQQVALSLALDATKLVAAIEVSTSHRKIMGGAYPNHIICTENLDKEEIDNILKLKPSNMTLEKATEVKVAILSFQSSPIGVPPSIKVAARPQSNNECSQFTQDMEAAMEKIAAKYTNVSFVNFAVDGVSLEAEDVRRAICDFLAGVKNHTGATDTNHDIKSWRYQIIGGSCIATVGKLVVDSDLLRQAGVSSELICPKDFASDLLVKKLTSYDTLQKLEALLASDAPNAYADAGALAATLFFMRLHLHAINGIDVPARQRAVYLWITMIWLTSLHGTCVTTRRNILAETISMVFLVMRSDVRKPHLLTSEPAEHDFGTTRTKKREFTSAEFASLSEKGQQSDNALYKGDLVATRKALKGYGSTCKYMNLFRILITFFVYLQILLLRRC